MNYEARLELIRALVGHNPPPRFPNRKALGQYLAAHPEIAPVTRAKWKREERRERKKLRSDLFGIRLHLRRNVWVTMPDHRQSHLRHKRHQATNPLVRIAERLPGKLPVLPATQQEPISSQRS